MGPSQCLSLLAIFFQKNFDIFFTFLLNAKISLKSSNLESNFKMITIFLKFFFETFHCFCCFCFDFRGFFIGKGKGTPMLKSGIKCTGTIPDPNESESQSDWKGF